MEVVSPPVGLGFDGKTSIFEAGRLKAAALIRPPIVSEGSPAVGLPLASARFGYVALPILLPIGVGNIEDGEPETGENWLVGEIELGGQHRSVRRLDLYVIVPRAARIEAGHDGAEGVAPLSVGKDVAAQAEALVVIFAVVVGLP